MISVYLAVIFAVTSLLLGFFAGWTANRAHFDRRIRRLAAGLEPIQRGDYSPDLGTYRDGALGLLTSQVELAIARAKSASENLIAQQRSTREFIADISHQIKTPLAGILSYLDLWSEVEADPQKARELDSAAELAQRINRLIQALLELSRLESRDLNLNHRKLNARELLQTAAETALSSRPGESRGINIAADGDISFRGDEKWLTQALVNLISNGLEYSSGDISLSALGAERTVFLQVSSRGTVSDEVLCNMFRRFYRANPDSKGFGLGLSIARGIARLHKGDLRAENREGRLCLTLSLPKNDCADSL